MASRAPDYCHRCGGPLASVDPPTVYRCEDCSEYAFHNPDPNGQVAVLDGPRLLLVEMTDESRLSEPPYEHDSEWILPGGHLEVGEQPQEGAARELREETGLVVDPDDLVLVDALARQVIEGAHSTIILYAVEREATSGQPVPDDDAAKARFWSPAELADSAGVYRELYEEPPEYRTVESLVRETRAALEGSG